MTDPTIEPRTLLLELRQALRQCAAEYPSSHVIPRLVLRHLAGIDLHWELTGSSRKTGRALVEVLDAVDRYLERQP